MMEKNACLGGPDLGLGRLVLMSKNELQTMVGDSFLHAMGYRHFYTKINKAQVMHSRVHSQHLY
jgi:hypothetical protein